ncbi:hypothetical protein AVEN_155704-1 [Araneus ventricosus]|uniref:Uncharacterized protein n=1 Tax=Araneus ventricosus TaxID=182803 RepID=A0A4Y2HXF3_ARAVE|nr:hypothetical protein AVEN_155704-1 [Araneus ventricosus]
MSSTSILSQHSVSIWATSILWYTSEYTIDETMFRRLNIASEAIEIPQRRRIRGLTPIDPNGNFLNIALHKDSTPSVTNKGINQNTSA